MTGPYYEPTSSGCSPTGIDEDGYDQRKSPHIRFGCCLPRSTSRYRRAPEPAVDRRGFVD
jgi:hypothetical protein